MHLTGFEEVTGVQCRLWAVATLGDADDVVPLEEGQKMYASAYEPKEIVILPGVDHVFSDDGLGQMTEAVTSWLKGHHS